MEYVIEREGNTNVEVSSYRGGICLNREGVMANICLTRSETLELSRIIEKLLKEPEYVVVLPLEGLGSVEWKYLYVKSNGRIGYTDSAPEVWQEGRLTALQLTSFDANIRSLAIPAEEFKRNEIGEF